MGKESSHFLGECLNAMFYLKMRISNSLHQQLGKKEGKKKGILTDPLCL